MKTNQNNVDTPKTITHISLCAGYGGIDIGLGRAIPSLRTIAFSEIEAFACANLVSKMEAGLLDAAPIWTNLKTFPWDEFRGKVDILSGGYPCQPFSAAGKRLGEEDPRHLWPFIADGIVRMRPRICFFENVEGHISLGLSNVIEDLAGMGYRSTWGVFSASEVGAPHQRKRVFILAHAASIRGEGESAQRQPECEGFASVANYCGDVWPSRPGEPQHGWEPPRTTSAMGNAEIVQRNGGNDNTGECQRSEAVSESGDASREAMGNAAEQGCQRSGGANDPRGSIDRPTKPNRGCEYGAMEQSQWKTQPPLGRDADGAAGGLGFSELSGLCDSELAEIREWMVKCDNRTDELRLLGNGVVPATAERAFRVLMAELTE
jgi:DNA (cytosine-5)-methyltransferase 1